MKGAIFEDGTHEGRNQYAPYGIGPSLDTEIALLAACRLESRRVRELVARVLAVSGSNDTEKAAQIRANILNLPPSLDKNAVARQE